VKLLIHICCANCAIYPIQKIRNRGINLYGLWFNPNIHPFLEYEKRMNSVELLKNKISLDLTFIDNYGLVDFIRKVVFDEKSRCKHCYSMRLEETAKNAKRLSMDAFTTSLLISPYQNINLINQICSEMSERYNIDYYGEDFRDSFYESRSLGREMGFYQQKYCGCIYSEMERYSKIGDRTKKLNKISK